MSLTAIAVVAATVALALVATLYGWASARAGRRPEPPLAGADQGPRGAHLGWFEARWARLLHSDVLYAVVVTRDRLLVFRIGGQFSGPNAYLPQVPLQQVFARESGRRAVYADELAQARPLEALLGTDPRNFAIQVADVRRATLRRRTGWAWAAWRGPAELVLERVSGSAVKYVIEDDWQLAACTRALERAVGDRLNVERALAPRVSHPDAGIERAIVRREWVSGAVLGILCTVMAALLLSVLSAQLERWNRPLEAVTAHLMSCKTTARPKSSATLEMTLDVAPYRVRTDEVSALLPACAQHAYVDIVYRELGFARTAWALSVRRVGGPELVSEAETARSWRANDRGVAAAAGAFGGLALAFFAVPPLWSRSRGNRRGVLTR